LLSQIVRDTGVIVNILEAKVTPTTGEMIVDISARGAQLEETILLFEKAGVRAEKILAIVRIEQEKCISCGACVSPCPVHAIRQNTDWSVELDEEKCVKCLICVDACPVRAIVSA
jgi:ferredoxin